MFLGRKSRVSILTSSLPVQSMPPKWTRRLKNIKRLVTNVFTEADGWCSGAVMIFVLFLLPVNSVLAHWLLTHRNLQFAVFGTILCTCCCKVFAPLYALFFFNLVYYYQSTLFHHENWACLVMLSNVNRSRAPAARFPQTGGVHQSPCPTRQ